MSRTIVLLFAIAIACRAATTTLYVTQDFTVANQGQGARVMLPAQLTFFSSGFYSSVPVFGFDLSSLAVIGSNSISSAILNFNNFTLLNDETSAAIALSYLNPGQNFDENTVTLNTSPTTQGSLGSVTFSSTGASPLDITTNLVDSLSRGGLFGFRVDIPGGPVSVPSHRSDPAAISITVTYGTGTTSTAAASTSAPASSATPASSSAPATSTTTSSPGSPTTSTTTSAPGSPTTTTVPPAPGTTTTRAPGTVTTTTARPATSSSSAPGTPTTTTTASPSSGTTTTAAVGPTSSLPGTTSASSTTTKSSGTTEAPRSSSGKAQVAVIMCIVPAIIALLL